jgi:benzoyl-CoA reductase subunit C
MIENFKQVYEKRHEYAKDWKLKHPSQKVVGYMCTYFPEEILYAAGVLPVRILGSHEPQNVTEPHIFGMFCPFSRDVLAQGLEGRYTYIDAVATAYPCMHLQQAFYSWTLHVTPKYFSVDMPNMVQSPHAYPFLVGVLEDFKRQVEEWMGNKITDDDLRAALAVYDEYRGLMGQVYDARKAEAPPLTGWEAMYITAATQFMDKKDAIKSLKEMLATELPGRTVKNKSATRLMIVGSENDDIKFMQMVESLNAIIVVDDHCTGSRYFWNQSVSKGNPIEVIAKRYIDRPACAQRDFPERKRLTHILNLAKDWNVAGAIVIQQKFCDPHELDKVALLKFLNNNGIPTLYLEFDVTVPIGQFRIRVEAFLESLQEEGIL